MGCILRLAKCDHNIILAIMKELTIEICFFKGSYNFVAQKVRILAVFFTIKIFWEITWKVLGFETCLKAKILN